jgi:dTDP-4-dehydrorhamnose reductase
MKVWITGANGLLGQALAAKGHLATSRSEADIASLSSLLQFAEKHPGITHIVNCAAQSLVDSAETLRKETFLANAIGPQNLAYIARRIGARLIHISTDYVFGGEGRTPLKETDPTAPCNYYGQTKLEGEWGIENIMASACILRVSWLFGAGGKNFAARLLELLQKNEVVQLTHDQWGRPTYVPDLVQTIDRLLNRSGLYQFANQGAATRYEFGTALREEALELGIPLKVKELIPVPSSTFASLAKRPAYSVFDTTKIEQELHLSIRPWRATLKEYLCNLYAPSHLSS